ncbi:PREDICTED: vascular endothelial growth factor receptor 1 [Papilio xuthus]|uniref:receptor protein-tyrosine kinase n=1 Tax=Papilio xuthus TaxID=66420 RepID=A0AAJ6ZLD5_PAPXU|nr:PREDICTED: vascular endothelial growth factor receptor 1 [Papilio xuthus]
MISSWSRRLLSVVSGFVVICATATAFTTAATETQTDAYETEGPIIEPSLKEIVLEKGQNFTIKCKGFSELDFKQQDIPEEVVGSLFNKSVTTVTNSDDKYKYQIELNLYDVDQFAIGYYACFDNTLEADDLLNNLMEEPKDTEHVTYIYVYVNGTNSVFAPMREVVKTGNGSKVVIECRPTTPDIKMTLMGDFPDYEHYDPKIGFTVDSDYMLDLPIVLVTCDAKRGDLEDSKDIVVHKRRMDSNKTPEFIKYSPKIGYVVKANRVASYQCEGLRGTKSYKKTTRMLTNIPPPQPRIIGGLPYFLSGETFSLNCTVEYQSNSALALTWRTPNVASKIQHKTNENETTGGILYSNITILNANVEDAGNYTCISKNSYGQNTASFKKLYLETGFIKLEIGGRKINPTETNQRLIQFMYYLQDYPTARITCYCDGKEIHSNKVKYDIKRPTTGKLTLTIRNLTVTDTANYTCVATNDYDSKNVTRDLRVKAAPVVDFGIPDDIKSVEGTIANLKCKATGYPTPSVEWIFTSESGDQQMLLPSNTLSTLITTTSYVQIPVRVSGNISCKATNSLNSSTKSRKFIVQELVGGFGIKDIDRTWFYESQNVVLTCVASVYDFANLTWIGIDDMEILDSVEFTNNSFSYVAKLKLNNISPQNAGNYTCNAVRYDNTEESQSIFITVAAKQPPIITEPLKEKNEEVYPYQPLQLTCQAEAVPPPRIEWYKDGNLLLNETNTDIITEMLDHSRINSSVVIKQMLEENKGRYECVAVNEDEITREYFNIAIKEKSTNKAAYLSVIGGIVFVLLLLIVYLVWKIRKEKQFRKELAAAGLLYFEEGVTKSLNPDIGIDEQAELLPYDNRFEFPAEKLLLGKQLGAGAFGVVYKAEARGIINAEETTEVAVKMVKKTADNMYIKALATELKIMVHLGKHVNIVNLLGACTKNVGKRELIVIVEYCKFGNIHNYLQKHREVFIDQLTDNKDKNLGKVNKGFSCSSGSSAFHSDYFSSNHTQETDNTFLNTGNTNRSGRKVSETGYVQPEWRSNYESDYSDGRAPRPLFSRDLLAWAFQIARGMEYLASRKVLHGDLAARNVLLAEDNIVKICDFGLARSIYKNDEYQKKENVSLTTDRIFSTQSDVWSFGVVLWELFSLAKTPYPNISPPSLLQRLSEGHRLEKPMYADDRLYEVMLRCWAQKPTARPSFTQLQEILGEFLEDNVRNHYVDLNSAYIDMNVKAEGQEDYLAMVCAPDYNNLVTPSPHQYVNDSRSFFPPTPTQLQHDDEGYLQMSPATQQTIFSPRATGTKFDFDARKLNPRTEATTHGSELTPMLTLNNLPARSGSESDHDGNSSPYLNMCPRIEEESDDVFETKQNLKNIQNSAVSNPTYITFDVDLEKKPMNTNNYINVPNGLVK